MGVKLDVAAKSSSARSQLDRCELGTLTLLEVRRNSSGERRVSLKGGCGRARGRMGQLR